MNSSPDPASATPADAVPPPPGAPAPGGDARLRRDDRWVLLAVALAAVAGHLPVLGAWWCRDDWGLLARAAGVLDVAGGLPARWLSQHLYWQLTWPLFGLEAQPHALLRLALHGAASALVVRLGRRGGLSAPAAALAGCAFAASPLAFVPLYWAAGIQELLAATLALLAIERWLAAGHDEPRALTVATLAAVASLLAKEAGLGLALLLGVLAARGAGPGSLRRTAVLAALGVMAAAAVAAALLALRHFDHGTGASYETGGALRVLVNLAFGARWLALPGPVVDATASDAALLTGCAVLAAWTLWGAIRWRRGQPLAIVALAGSVLALAPVLPLERHLAPYMAYLSVAGWALTLGTLVPRRLPRPRAAIIAGLVAATAWGLLGTHTILTRRNGLGLPTDDLVRATSLSWEAAGLLRNAAAMGGGTPVRQVTLLQIPVGPAALEHSRRFGERWAGRTDLHEALAGDLGPALLVPAGVIVHWRNGLVTAPDSALVLVETGTGLRPWGRTGQAALYAALTDVGLDHFDRAREHLLRAALLGGRSIGFACDEGLLPIPLAMVTRRQEAFIDWTVGRLAQGSSRAEIGGLQDLFYNLLCACTGRSLEELTRGSTVLMPGDPPAGTDPRR